ncbi:MULTISPECIES: rhomboid family intramembrane serine protease [Chryseobacterium]|jgi:membrane associated rhomboid family serine protease|uniref:Membrane associated rhomboid family serine protease n=1 Tax=Chryseobacterium rhizosphaerae TaxID=395937 RepID=A0AAE3YAV4_9FLAO|nr:MULTISPECIES: rhomboid family intramembrane serine protease [Chryseobacterium]MBL3549835.1 rhomboid family intramembrane serine protease [Chryseobacterium sp. KMC2]MDC8102290.1 rhomboid family intramembrane serine protease [Chryseobacterium rhizosphaerae]MDR6526776.1 membrane associated rhomboid family serine protease [Chryseobacterium rhizosphaerae]MDR6544635.1 membrane associated rhomboid family serine protease [Chryseobacterium rhizosphaerae]SMC74394.1 Membrane associated serine protease
MFKNVLSKRAIIYPLLMLSAMWFGYFLQMRGFFGSCFGAIIPLVPEGLLGVITSPLLHGNIDHIIGNSIPIAALMFLLYQFYPLVANKVFIIGWLATGLLVWLLPPIDILTGDYMYTCTIGASGVVYVLAFFLFFSGVFKWNTKLLTISLLVVLYYGSLIWGMLPEELFYTMQEPSKISWQAHLSGAVVGSIIAFAFKNVGEKKKKYIWEFPNYYSEKDDKLWQEYKENHPEDFLELPYKKRDDIWNHLEELRKK